MQNVLEKIQEQNPEIDILSVTDKAFADYGRKVVLQEQGDFEKKLASTQIPHEGNVYIRDDISLFTSHMRNDIARNVYGEQAIEIGYCNGNSDRINAFEWHNCSEINLAQTDLILFLARQKDVVNNTITTRSAQAFFVPKGTAIEIYPTILHFAPCRVWKSGFRCLVVLTKDTNTQLEDAREKTDVLFQKNKWLLTHVENKRMVEKGACIGVVGANTQIIPLTK
ncbi:DUF4867 family protein [Ligilactobacillus sp. WILCCON 0076]|uniref:DUF4867 family protein n=1 Tax=Ligilactobacillus ubinensis TaxID=2876789 RepID=A0A9X2FJF4_9LACO|nr:DUF4867 family protein [Ligilactobacillus ubinensis]MCP0886852.1 DUF4867 family protein [Ligilactobacillus ubinensis]